MTESNPSTDSISSLNGSLNYLSSSLQTSSITSSIQNIDNQPSVLTEQNSINIFFDSNSLQDIILDDIQVEPEAAQALGQLIEREVKEIVEMLLETTAIQGKYTAQDIRQLLSLKGFNICY